MSLIKDRPAPELDSDRFWIRLEATRQPVVLFAVQKWSRFDSACGRIGICEVDWRQRTVHVCIASDNKGGAIMDKLRRTFFGDGCDGKKVFRNCPRQLAVVLHGSVPFPAPLLLRIRRNGTPGFERLGAGYG